MTTLKIFDGIMLTVDNETEFFPDMEAFDFIHIPQDLRRDLIATLLAMHELDLSQAYAGHKVFLKMVPAKEVC